MPLRRISGADAIRNYRTNPFAAWPTREVLAANRIEPMCKPGFNPSFRLEWGEKIFTIGSCFARHIERALMTRGFDVVTSQLAWPDRSMENLGNSILNNYGVASIENEFRWALDPDHPFDPAMHFFELRPDGYVDAHIAVVRPAPLEKVLAYRSTITEVTRRVRECRVVIMTLGLSELWFDTVSGTYLNQTPLRSIVAKFPGRFELHQLGIDETLASLNLVISLLRKHCRADQRIVLTVSPVPLAHTHTADDVLVANCYSKSLLRVAAEHIAAENEHVDYFPSYESVTLSDRAHAWEDDQVHVRDAMVRVNVERMVSAYTPEPDALSPGDIQLRLTEAREATAAGDTASAMAILEPLRNVAQLDPKFVVAFAELSLRTNRVEDADEAMSRLPPDDNDLGRLSLDARIAIKQGKVDDGLVILERLTQRAPKNARFWVLLAEGLMQVDRLDDALVAVRRSLELAPTQTEPLRRLAQIHKARGDIEAADRVYRQLLTQSNLKDFYQLEYVEFLIECKRFDDAAREIAPVRPETKWTHHWRDRLSLFLSNDATPGTQPPVLAQAKPRRARVKSE